MHPDVKIEIKVLQGCDGLFTAYVFEDGVHASNTLGFSTSEEAFSAATRFVGQKENAGSCKETPGNQAAMREFADFLLGHAKERTR